MLGRWFRHACILWFALSFLRHLRIKLPINRRPSLAEGHMKLQQAIAEIAVEEGLAAMFLDRAIKSHDDWEMLVIHAQSKGWTIENKPFVMEVLERELELQKERIRSHLGRIFDGNIKVDPDLIQTAIAILYPKLKGKEGESS